jgi:ligand-binding sensor domain-containing protein/signal transduction histidine kinase
MRTLYHVGGSHKRAIFDAFALVIGSRQSAAAFCLLAFVGAMHEATANEAPTEATLNPETLRLPVTDGAGIRFVRLGGSSGLSQTRVSQIVQDNQGFLWFATQYGLDRYDGYNFQHYKPDPRNPDSISGVNIYALFKDDQGALWVGCYNSLDRLDPATERVTHYQIDVAGPGGPQRVIHISQDKNGMLWLASANGLYMLDPLSGRTRHFAHSNDDPFSLSSNSVISTMQDRSGNLWVVTSEGIDRFEYQAGRVTLHIPLREGREMYIHQDRHGRYWIVYGSGNGLAEYDPDSNVVTRYTFAPGEASVSALTGVIALLEDNKGTLWLGTATEGILKFDVDNGRFIRFKNRPDDPTSLTENRVASLYQDREGSIWSGLGASEPVVFTDRAPSFTQIREPPGNIAGLGEKLVDAIFVDQQGTLWLATTGALSRIDRRDGRYRRYQIPGGGVSDDVLSIAQDKAQTLWLGTSGEGLVHFDPKTETKKAYRHVIGDPTSVSSNTVYRLLVDHAGTLWATTSDGLVRYDAKHNNFVTYRVGDGPAIALFGLVEDGQGGLLTGSKNGLLRFDPSSSSFSVVDAKEKYGERINSIFIRGPGDYWLGTQYGLRHIDLNGKHVSNYSEKEGLASSGIDCVLGDDAGNLWMSTTRGISKFEIERGTFDNYTVSDGLPGEDMTGWGACYKSPNGELFFGGFAGGASFFPGKVQADIEVPIIVLTELDIAGEPVSPKPHTSLSQTIGYTRKLTLPFSQNSIALGFSALSFRSPSTNRYRYRLSGIDNGWQQVSSDRRLASYTALAPGDYQFNVQGATIRGRWSEPGAVLDITILPPWWATSWFRSLAGAIALLGLVSAYKVRVRQIARQFQMRLQVRIHERARIARDLHDSILQGIQGLLLRLQAVRNMLPEHPDQAASALDDALDRADRSVAEGRSAVEDLRSNKLISTDPVGTLRDLGRDLLEWSDPPHRSAYCVVIEGQARPLDEVVGDDVYFIAREALRNAINHGNATEIETELAFGDSFSMRIRDNGVGIDAAVIREGQRTGHWGLPGMRERAQSIGAKLRVWSERGAGTEIELTVPGSIAFAKRALRGSTTEQEKL